MKTDYCYFSSNDDEHFISSCGANYRFIGKDKLNYCPYCGRLVTFNIKRKFEFLEKMINRWRSSNA